MQPIVSFFGRRKGRALNNARATALETLLPKLRFDLPENGTFDAAKLFDGATDIHLEIGFGAGEHLAEQAATQPQIGFIGAEPFVNGYSTLLTTIERDDLKNIRLWPEDMRPMLETMQPGTLGAVYLLFSDPWPKARHAKRRVLQQATIALFARALRQGGILKIATDDPTLQDWVQEQMDLQTLFAPAPGLHDNRPNWPATRYEQKAITVGRRCKYWEFKKI